MSTNNALKSLYASGGSAIRLACLSFECDEWADDVHLCQGWTDFTAALEDGNVVTFVAADFAAKLPAESGAGNQSLAFTIDPGESDAVERVDAAMRVGAGVKISYREYVMTDVSGPARTAITMSAISYSLLHNDNEGSVLSFTASFHDLTNRAWPRRFYTTSLTPGLKHYAG